MIPTDKQVEASTDGGKTWTDAAGGTMAGEDGTTYLFRYKEDENHYASPATVAKVNVPTTVTTIQAATKDNTTATLYGTVSKLDGVTAVGFKYKKVSDSAWTDAAGAVGKAFNAALTGLTADTDYVFYAVATKDGQEIKGAEVKFHTTAPTGSITVEVKSNGARDVIASIERGNDPIASQAGTTDCELKFGSLPDGFYNVVVRTTDGDYTETRMIEVKNHSAEKTVFNIPVGKLATVNKKDPTEPVRITRTGSDAFHMQLSCPRYRSMIAAFSSCVAAAARICPHTRPQASASQHNRPQCGRLLVRRRRAEERSREYHLVAGARRKLSPCPMQGAKYRHLQGVLTPGREKNERK